MEEKEGTRRFDLEANKIMMEQLELLKKESESVQTTAIERVLLSQAMVNIYKAVLNQYLTCCFLPVLRDFSIIERASRYF